MFQRLKHALEFFNLSKKIEKLSPSGFQEDAFHTWYGARELHSHMYGYLAPSQLSHLQLLEPREWNETLTSAKKILMHEFNLLGSGPVSWIDPDRKKTSSGYIPIDWYYDPVANLRFPKKVPYKEWKLYEMRPGLADIKLPWELARCQHWVTLAQAFLQSGDDRYAQEIIDQLADFQEANPVGYGIHWTCTMDVAIRAANWALAFKLLQNWKKNDPSFWRIVFGALFEHGVFIYENLENNYEVTSNHFLSNVVGLYFVSSWLQTPSEVETWDNFCRTALEEEINKQILDDGADFESSIPYHRLVAELFLGAARLAQLRGAPFSENYHARLRMMVDFLVGVIRPDGLMPQIGDADDGRLHIFTGYGRWNPQDPRHLLTPAAGILNEPKWLSFTEGKGAWESAWWGIDRGEGDTENSTFPPQWHLYPEAGLVVFRNQGAYLLISNGKVGTEGFGNHKHNDLLSFEYHLNGCPIFVDPGSDVYTSNPDSRNYFRSTKSHNTLMVDNTEQNEMNPEWLFRLFERAHPVHSKFQESEKFVEYSGRHYGYEVLSQPLVHERFFRLCKETTSLMIQDRLIGQGSHVLQWHFHVDPAVKIEQLNPTLFLLQTPKGGVWFGWKEDLGRMDSQVLDAWYSPSYGVRKPCSKIEIKKTIENLQERVFAFFCIPINFSSVKSEEEDFADFCQQLVPDDLITPC